jgi:hypothetical protein
VDRYNNTLNDEALSVGEVEREDEACRLVEEEEEDDRWVEDKEVHEAEDGLVVLILVFVVKDQIFLKNFLASFAMSSSHQMSDDDDEGEV